MRTFLFTSTFILFFQLTPFGQQIKDLNINYMLRGYFYAASSIEDTISLGGFGGSDNLPKKIESIYLPGGNQVILYIDTTQKTIINGEYNGYKIYLANTTSEHVAFAASDSRLSIIAEVYHEDVWKPIEYLPSSWCGNSYHFVYLNKNEYWEFNVPKYTGKINSKLRYKLKYGDNNFIYSNEIPVSFNKDQLENKQGHEPTGIMDPYND